MKSNPKTDGYERIESGIREIEDAAWTAVTSFNDAAAKVRLQVIVTKARKLRQIVREVMLEAP